MNAIEAFGTLPYVESETIETNLTDLDTGTIVVLCPAKDTYKPGDEAPDLEGFTVDKVSRARDGEDWRLTLSVSGMEDKEEERIVAGYPKCTRGRDDWDTATIQLITKSEETYLLGEVMPGFANMKLVDVAPYELMKEGLDWVKVTLNYKGFLATKTYKRSITVNGQAISPTNPIIVTQTGGWTPTHKGTLSWPKIVVTDIYFETVAPATENIPGRFVPDNPPTIQTMPEVTGPHTKVWPNEWTMTNISSDELFTTGPWKTTYTYEYIWPRIPD